MIWHILSALPPLMWVGFAIGCLALILCGVMAWKIGSRFPRSAPLPGTLDELAEKRRINAEQAYRRNYGEKAR